MVRHHVAQRARVFVVTAALFYPNFLRRGDLDAIDITTIPNRLEDAVAETKDQNILDCFFSKIMIDAINLAFVEDLFDASVQLLRRRKVSAEWFFDDHASPVIIILVR